MILERVINHLEINIFLIISRINDNRNLIVKIIDNF